MKTLKFSKDSWHYRYIKKYTDREDYDLDNICAYTRGFLQATLIALFLLLIVTLICFGLTQVLVGIGFSLYYGMWIFSEPAVIFMAVSLGVFIFFGSLFSYIKIKEVYQERSAGKTDGFVVNAYKSWKDKFCARVEIV